MRKETVFVAYSAFDAATKKTKALMADAGELLAAGHKVLIIDLAVQSPGLTLQLSESIPASITGFDGLVCRWEEFLGAGASDESFDWELGTTGTAPIATSDGVFDLMPAINIASEKWIAHQMIEWSALYAALAGGVLFEGLKETIRRAGYDYALVDSDAGFSDTFYTASLTLADRVVICRESPTADGGYCDSIGSMAMLDAITSEYGALEVVIREV